MTTNNILEGKLGSIADKKLNHIAKRVTNTVRLAAYKAVAHATDPANYKISSDPKSLEQLMLARFKTRKPEVAARAAQRAKAFLNLNAEQKKKLGELAKIDLRSVASVEEQAHAVPIAQALRLDRAHVERLIKTPQLFLDGSPASSGQIASAQTEYDKLELRIRKVRCADETSGFGSDEIMLGGTSMDESGEHKIVKPFLVGDDFDDGESKVYTTPKRFTWFDLREKGKHWPKLYFVSLIFCEQDNGGFPGFLKDVLDHSKALIATLLGPELGALAGSIVPGMGNLIGAAIGAVLGGLIDVFIDIWEDDVFPAFTFYAGITSYNHLFASGRHTSSEKYFWASAHGGKYECWIDWRVYN